MTKRHPFAGIQRRILFITLSCILCMCILISSVSFFIFRNYLQQSLMQSTETSLRLLADSVDESINDVYRMVRYCQTNSDIATYIENNPNPGSVLSVATYDTLAEEYNRNASSNYMPRLAIVSHDNFLQVVATTYSSTSNLAEQLPTLSFFDTLLSDTAYNFSPGLIADPFHRKGRQVLPIIRPITYQYNAKQAGYLFIEVSADLFADPIKRYSIAPDSFVYLNIDNHTYLYQDGVLIEHEKQYETLEDLSGNALNRDTTITKIKTADGSSQIVVSTPLDMPNCYLSQGISRTEFFDQLLLFIGILSATLIGILAIGVLLVVIMNRMIHVPVRKLQSKMLRIAEGDFTRDPSIEWNHELGEIGRGINDLSENVSLLMNKRLEDEKQKRDLEYKMLQSQINPHFLYNTLELIRADATAGRIDQVSAITAAMGRFYRYAVKGSPVVTLQEEMEHVKAYMTIQQERFNGKITVLYNISAEAERIPIPKMILQPLVENAIIHGLEPAGGGGILFVGASVQEGRLTISVRDSGIGITPEKLAELEALLQSPPPDRNSIGLSNVSERLRLQYGGAGVFRIESSPDDGTCICLELPTTGPEKA